MKFGRRRLIVVSAVVLCVAGAGVGGFVGYQKWRESQRFLPTSMAQQIHFAVFRPAHTARPADVKKTLNFQASSKFLTYKLQHDSGATLTITQQATPESFVDVPLAYDKLIESLQQYSAFDSVQGKVFLTHPPQLHGSQSAVMNAKGTLMFIYTTKELSDDAWRALFNSFIINT